MACCPTNAKRSKKECVVCIICGKDGLSYELVKPKDQSSWQSLYDAAKTRLFDPILSLVKDDLNHIPNVHYHRDCRSSFTHKKELTRIKNMPGNSSLDSTKETVRHSLRQTVSESHRTYNRVCIFCEHSNKCLKGTSTREALVQAVDLRADMTLRSIANLKCDTKILAITSRDIVAAEACYHASCYKKYTKYSPKNELAPDVGVSNKESDYDIAESKALRTLYTFIRVNLFSNPRVVALADFTLKLVELLRSDGFEEVRQSTRTHIRRNLEMEFGDTLHFFNVGSCNNVYVMPHNLSIECLARDFIHTKQKLDSYIENEGLEQKIDEVALLIRERILKDVTEQPWPPNPQELNDKYIQLPDNLVHFLEVLLGGSQIITSDKVRRISFSIGQDIISAVTNSKVLTPKHILLPWVVKTLTGNVELIKILNRLGHGCSYTRLQEIDTALCIDKMSCLGDAKPPLPSWTTACIPTLLAFDNIDRIEETLTGAGTSHRVNGIIVQSQSLSCMQERVSVADKRDKRRSLNLPEQTMPIYISTKREDPPKLKWASISETLESATANAKQKNLLWLISRMHDTVHQKISSWTGFNIKTCDNITVQSDKVGYLPTINAPATELSTVMEILSQSVSIQQHLGLKQIAVIMDQALYAKAAEVKWKYKDRFNNILLMMGNFHVICNMLSIIGKMFSDAGLRDLAVESGVIAEGSIDKVLDGKQYNRGVRLHKLVYEALMRLVWAGFVKWLGNHQSADVLHLDTMLKAVGVMHTDPSAETLTSCINDKSCQRILHMFRAFLDVLRNDRGHLSKFWMLYIDMVEILLGLIRADRSGDWHLHLGSIKAMIPWCFAMDKTNYCRYFPVYYAEISQLDKTCPDLHAHFLAGGFSVQLGQTNPFAKIPVDQTLEKTVNKDTQTAGGTKGFSLKQSTLTRFYMTSEHRASALRQLRELIAISGESVEGLGHVDLQSSRIKRDEADVISIVDMLENIWTNPFSGEPSDLVSISTGAVASPIIVSDMLKAHSKGEDAFKVHMNRLETGTGFYEPIKKLKLKTINALQKDTVIKASANKEIILKSDNRVFGQMLLIAQNRKLDMKEAFEYPLGPIPWALANADGTMKKTGKSTLGMYFEKRLANVELPSGSRATIVDAMATLQMVNGENSTFDELSDIVLKKILNDGRGSNRIDVVLDVYLEQSIKAAERTQRGSKVGIVFSQIKAGHRI